MAIPNFPDFTALPELGDEPFYENEMMPPNPLPLNQKILRWIMLQYTTRKLENAAEEKDRELFRHDSISPRSLDQI
ncbi:hypothetical protein L484_010279 [Morus notabilis]|uniref:Uncharacterized protein n=1 Tax=Morus notabilis TaxID=981085 RepID=W9QXY2_9ROSA|nr:hypothetical protein L484_010279 [Morus notabilis]